jgi:hypothetical protein
MNQIKIERVKTRNAKGKKYLNSNRLNWSGYGQAEKLTCGYCVCPECRTKIPHQCGRSCYEQFCPICGAALMRVQSNTIDSPKKLL